MVKLLQKHHCEKKYFTSPPLMDPRLSLRGFIYNLVHYKLLSVSSRQGSEIVQSCGSMKVDSLKILWVAKLVHDRKPYPMALIIEEPNAAKYNAWTASNHKKAKHTVCDHDSPKENADKDKRLHLLSAILFWQKRQLFQKKLLRKLRK